MKNSTDASAHPRGYRPCLLFLVTAAWFGFDVSYGQSIYSGLRVPVQVLPGSIADQQMFAFPGYVPSGTQVDPLSHYQRSRLGRWLVEKEVEPGDGVFGIELETSAGKIRIRFETTINGKPFRAVREKTIDELLTIARGEAKPANEVMVDDDENINDSAANEETQVVEDPIEPEEESVVAETYVAASTRDRMVAYARSRGDRVTRYELRRRVADIAGGPALLRTANDFGSQRHETLTLFALLDVDEDGTISLQERSVAVKALNDRDVNSDGRLDWNELRLGLKSRTAQRKTGSAVVGWQSWEVTQSRQIEDLRVAVSFSDEAADSGLTIDECELDEPWSLVTAEVQRAGAEEPHSPIVLISHPRLAIALSAAQSAGDAHETADQISIGVTMESNALFRQMDRDGNWILSTEERRSCSEVIALLDKNADGALTASELPILLRVCVARGATAHEALLDSVSIVRQSDEEKEQPEQAAPAWFTSMDRDGDRTLTREEFLGKRKSFIEIDTDKNERLSVAEALAAQSN